MDPTIGRRQRQSPKQKHSETGLLKKGNSWTSGMAAGMQAQNDSKSAGPLAQEAAELEETCQARRKGQIKL